MLKNDPLSNVLYINLSDKSFYIKKREELFEKYIGGTGVAITLLEEEIGDKQIDPLAPENPIIFAVGPLNALFPMASKTVAMFKSPHTGNLGESHCGGRSAVSIRLAGLGAIVIRGRSDYPVYIVIDNNKVYFRDASAIWGIRSSFTVGKILRENEKGSGYRTIMRIGQAGEQMVSYASVTTETYRHFGRLGLGAVFGSKMLKGVVISGRHSLPVLDRITYNKIYNKIYKETVNQDIMKKYHDLGTPQNVLPLNEFGGLPTKNLTERKFEFAEKLSGEHFAENYLGRRLACSHCPVGCIHIAALREPYEDEPYFYKTSMISYDYEPIYAIGTMLGLNNAEDFLRLMDTVEVMGMDVMSTGVTLAWATEAYKKNYISKQDTLGINFEWGDVAQYMEATKLIVKQPNDFYKALAKGVEYASSIYGGEEFALAFGRNEMPGYHTGPASHLGYLIGARHSHLDNAGYSVDQKIIEEIAPEELAEMLIKEEAWRQILSSLVICFFARNIYKPSVVSDALKVSDINISEDKLLELGMEIFRKKYKFKFNNGYDLKNARIPERVFETESPHGFIKPDYMRNVLSFAEKILKNE